MRTNVDGFHAHHLIPKQVARHRYFAQFMADLKNVGLNLDDFERNGIYLPYSERLGEIFQLPVHRGAHPLYNAMVSHHVAGLMHLPIEDAAVAIRMLQLQLRAGLRSADSTPTELARNPMSTGLQADMDIIGLLGDRRARIVRIS
jgi:A nuclease family of the HNH/ENDO VII superfamily with conserved AHH